MCNLSLWRRHLVNAYEVEAGIGVIAGKTVWSMPERLACTFTFMHCLRAAGVGECSQFVSSTILRTVERWQHA